jgi:hypothetical protein
MTILQRRRVNALVAYCPFLAFSEDCIFWGTRARSRRRMCCSYYGRLFSPGTAPVWWCATKWVPICPPGEAGCSGLSGKGLRLSSLPAHSPQFNYVEAVLQVNHYELPARSYTTLDEVVAAVRSALRRYYLRLRFPGQHLYPGA